MDYEEVMNLTDTVTQEESIKYVAHEIIFLICCTAAFFADVAVVYTMLYFKQMRYASNLLIANWAIVDLLSLLVVPTGYRFVSIINQFDLPKQFLCVLLQMSLALHFMTIVAVYVVLTDWCLAAYCPKLSKRFRTYHKFVAAFTWVLLIVFSIVLCIQCPSHRYNKFVVNAGFVTLFVLLVYVVIVRFVNMVKKHKGHPVENSKLALNLCTAFMVCYVLAIANFLLDDVLRARHPVFQVISLCCIFCNSIVTLIMLYFCDKRFQTHLKKGFQCKFRRLKRSASSSENLDNDPFSEVSFHCPTQQLLTNN